jgi:hypothetical protein
MVAAWKKFIARHAPEFFPAERRFPNRREESRRANGPNRSSALRPFWQREYWDTFMRDEKQEKTAIRYIENNPIKARLCQAAEHWPCSSARFRDRDRQLIIHLGRPAVRR